METDAALSKSFVLLTISLKCRGLNFPYCILSYLILWTTSDITLGSTAEGVFPLCLFAFSPPRNHSFLPASAWPTSVRLVPSRVSRPLTILQWASCQLASALNSTLLLCSFCLLSKPPTSVWNAGSLDARPDPSLLRNPLPFCFAVLSLFVWVDLFRESFSPSSFCYRFTCAPLFISSSFCALFVFIQSHVGSAFISNHTHLCLCHVFMWVFNHY